MTTKPIDWTRPLRTTEPTPRKIDGVIIEGDRIRVVAGPDCWLVDRSGHSTAICPPRDVENVPPEPRIVGMSARAVAKANLSQCCGPADCGYRNPDDGIRYCVAAACMGWRWSDPYQLDAKGNAHHIDRKADSKTGPLRAIHAGYCGLGGKP